MVAALRAGDRRVPRLGIPAPPAPRHSPSSGPAKLVIPLGAETFSLSVRADRIETRQGRDGDPYVDYKTGRAAHAEDGCSPLLARS